MEHAAADDLIMSLSETLFALPPPPTHTHRCDLDLDCGVYPDECYDRVYDFQRVPASLSPPPPAKRPHSSSYSSGHRRSRDRAHAKTSRAQTTSPATAKLGLEELQLIKKELTLIKTQIDGLLVCLDRMDTQRDEHRGCPLREDSPSASPCSSPERSLPSLSPPTSRQRVHRGSLDPREPDDQDRHRMSPHSSELEEEM
ncbi:heterogeneous nuclear ribonucleoprotein C-like [Genypterus blacodes]|uniref:heterogeneous nuclear ribonucleoprotein C-like n=1 Tax=Genypterus blacodes TaxID=154954 RepID=UPI003F768671